MTPGPGAYNVNGAEQAPGSAAPGGVTDTGESALPSGEYHVAQMCSGTVCMSGIQCADGSYPNFEWIEDETGRVLWSNQFCPAIGDRPTITPPMVADAFQRIPLPASPLIIQPPGGKTLVNFETNFYTEQRPLDRTVRLLGQRIELRISVASYTWHFDDGAVLRTSKPGAPYPHLQITHNYLQKGGYRPSLDTTYVADYRVNGGAWHTVPGSVTIEGDAKSLRAIEARPVLVG
ncbi:hypothetical protein [Nocardioides panacisoli]|uniref:hypothetical protein n=1 Tax=Nocardioides panacisoli TaxID=627624 RepID=UPI0031DB9AA8